MSPSLYQMTWRPPESVLIFKVIIFCLSSLFISITGQHCEAGQHPESPTGDHSLERSGVRVAGEVERLEPSTEGPLGQVLQGGVQDDRLASLVRQGGGRIGGDHFDAFTPTTEEEGEEEEGQQIKTWTQKH